MFCNQLKKDLATTQALLQQKNEILTAIHRSMAVIEFDLTGKILTANENFLAAVGYSLSEIQGQHHRMFVSTEYAQSAEYAQFWAKLASGKFFSASYQRFGKGGKEIWIEATYNPIFDASGKPYKVIKFASDITEHVKATNEAKCKLEAIDRAMAIIEFDLTGKILTANENFLATLGYSLSEIQGQHHRMFVAPEYAQSAEYAQFWATLAAGKYFTDTYQRVGKGGKEVWIEASYNPIFDVNGKPYKVVKFAADAANKQKLLKAVNVLVDVMSETAQGNLMRRIEGKFDGELEQLQTSINTMLDKVSGAVQTVSASAHVVNDISAQLTQKAADLSSRIQEQAASLGQTSSTMHQMTSSVQSSTDNAQKVAELTRQVQQQSSDGVKVMNDTIGAMKSIQEASSKIADIVSLIDSIAFQTNLLALNAAVEAARAGEHGRGFAVVASEVRALAGKSANAAKDIKALINDSVARIHAGTQLADKSGEMLNDISHSVSQVASMIEQIAGASKEQSAGIQQLGQAITSIDRMTQENAALVEESSAAAVNLNSEADHLRDNMAFFNTGSAVREAPRARPAVNAGTRPSAKKPAALPHAPKKHSSEEWGEF